tara:strand:- start:1625 stop:2635 length:1011 start_codon:yes stop_codon:yes gene_type:complete
MEKLISKNEKIFIAGSTGMAGSAIKKQLIKNNYGNIQHGGVILSPNRKELDLFDTESVKNWFSINNPSVVILAAAKVGGIKANSSYGADFLLENLKIQNNVIEAAWRNSVKRLIFLGSSCIYPRNCDQPIKEEFLLNSHLEQTNEAYAVAKIAGLKLCEHLNIQYGFDAISLMPTNLYGPGDNYHPENSHVVASLIRRFLEAKNCNYESITCWGTGNVWREFLHSDDLGSAVVFALENWDPKSIDAPKDNEGKPLYFLNVGTGKDITIKNLSELISELVGFQGITKWDTSKPDGTPKKQLDISKISKLGWEPTISLKQGLKRTIKELTNEKLFKNL